MSIRTITAPPYYPVSLAEAKLWLRESGTDQDALITMLIAAMTAYAENLTQRAFIQRSLELNLPNFEDTIALPWAPLISIDYVKYIDTGGTLTTLSAAIYESDIYAEPGRLQPVYLQSWPSIRSWDFNPVRIGFTCGYAPGSPAYETGYQDAIPDAVKLWMHARIATLYENREQLIMNNQVQIPRHFADGLLDELTIGTRIA